MIALLSYYALLYRFLTGLGFKAGCLLFVAHRISLTAPNWPSKTIHF